MPQPIRQWVVAWAARPVERDGLVGRVIHELDGIEVVKDEGRGRA
jgi:hypothetical protein